MSLDAKASKSCVELPRLYSLWSSPSIIIQNFQYDSNKIGGLFPNQFSLINPLLLITAPALWYHFITISVSAAFSLVKWFGKQIFFRCQFCSSIYGSNLGLSLEGINPGFPWLCVQDLHMCGSSRKLLPSF